MTNYREILRLHSLGNSQRSIAGEVHSSRDTVADAIKAAKAAGITWPLDDDVTNEDIQEILFPGKYVFASPYTVPDFQWIHNELARNVICVYYNIRPPTLQNRPIPPSSCGIPQFEGGILQECGEEAQFPALLSDGVSAERESWKPSRPRWRPPVPDGCTGRRGSAASRRPAWSNDRRARSRSLRWSCRRRRTS